MNPFKSLISFWVVLFALTSCEQEEALQRSTSSSVDPKTEFKTKSLSPSRNFEMLDVSKVPLDRNGYQRVHENKTTASVLYAYIKDKKIVAYLIRKRDGQRVQFVPPGHGGQCPDIYVCIHPETGKYIYYDKCETKEDPCKPICQDLVWCIDPETGNYILYDKCKTDTSPCERSTPPIIFVNKKYNAATFCPTVDYNWMIDPDTGEYVLTAECDFGYQLFLEVGW